MKMSRAILAAMAIAVNGTSALAEPKVALNAYWASPPLERVELSPDGTHLAFVGSDPAGRSLTVVEIGGSVLSSSPIAWAQVGTVRWASEDVVLVSTIKRYTGGTSAPSLEDGIGELTVIDLKRRTSYPIAKSHPFINSGSVFATRELNGRLYAYVSGYNPRMIDDVPGPGLRGVVRVDLEARQATVFNQRDGVDYIIDKEGKIAAFIGLNVDKSRWLFAVGQEKRGVFASTTPLRLMGLSETGDGVILGPATFEFGPYYEVSLDGARQRQRPELAKASRLWFDPKSERLIGYTGPVDEGRTIMFDPHLQARLRGAEAAFPGKRARLMSVSSGLGRMVMLTESSDDPGSYWVIDIATGKATSIGARYAVPAEGLGTVRHIAYTARDGMNLSGVLTLPRGKPEKNLPLIVLPHDLFDPPDTAVYEWRAQAFASRGYAVFQPNYRGSYGIDLGYWYKAKGEYAGTMQSDIADGVAFLAGQGLVDPKRACMVGAGYGGYSALMAATRSTTDYRCAVVDHTYKIFEAGEVRFYMGIEAPHGGWLNADVSKVYAFDQSTPSPHVPVLLIDGKPSRLDDALPVLKRAGNPVDIVVAGTPYGLVRPEERAAFIETSVAFVEKHNPPN